MSIKNTTRRVKQRVLSFDSPLFIIGFGAVGRSLFWSLVQARYTGLTVISKKKYTSSQRTLLAACSQVRCTRIKEAPIIPKGAIVFLTVPEKSLPEVSLYLQSYQHFKTFKLVSVSGSLDILDFKRMGLLRVVQFHPLYPFVKHECIDLKDVPVGLSHRPKWLLIIAQQLGMHVFYLPKNRALYHAVAVLASSSLVAYFSLLCEALHQQGMPIKQAQRVLIPMIQKVLLNSTRVGFKKALTGPVVRQDEPTIKRHMQALDAMNEMVPLSLIAQYLVKQQKKILNYD